MKTAPRKWRYFPASPYAVFIHLALIKDAVGGVKLNQIAPQTAGIILAFPSKTAHLVAAAASDLIFLKKKAEYPSYCEKHWALAYR